MMFMIMMFLKKQIINLLKKVFRVHRSRPKHPVAARFQNLKR